MILRLSILTPVLGIESPLFRLVKRRMLGVDFTAMNATSALALAFAIGLICGLRSLTGPAVVSWAAHWKWIDINNSRLAFFGSTGSVFIISALALVEMVVDKLPKTPRRTALPGLIARLVLGGLSGSALCAAGNQSVAIGAVLGGLGGLVGAYVGYQARSRLVKALNVPDVVIALIEDAVAIGGGFLIVSRF
ncbi:MAG TPA: DUF4126 family protein [Blastocatellia bacterium]|nr:DUF4126 family protein [Blastocatellia bacterium]